VIDEHVPDRDLTSEADRIEIHRIDYRRWSWTMIQLSQALWDLPRRPGARGPSSLDLGIDRLRTIRLDPSLVVHLLGYFNPALLRRHLPPFSPEQAVAEFVAILIRRVVDEFEHRPTAAEVERIGRELVLIKLSLDQIRQDHRRMRQEEADRDQAPRLRRGPRAGG